MIAPSDPDYRETKEIVLGTQDVKAEYVSLIDWVENTFDHRPINIYVDDMEKGLRQRVNIIFKTAHEVNFFRGEDGFFFDTSKQNKVERAFSKSRSLLQKLGTIFRKSPYVIFTEFDKVARWDAVNQVSEEDIAAAVSADLSQLWRVKIMCSEIIIFLFTNADLKGMDHKMKRTVTTTVAHLLKEHDFCECCVEDVAVSFDSKEKFEDGYEGNWFFYSRR